jgi:hypothetical protein
MPCREALRGPTAVTMATRDDGWTPKTRSLYPPLCHYLQKGSALNSSKEIVPLLSVSASASSSSTVKAGAGAG